MDANATYAMLANSGQSVVLRRIVSAGVFIDVPCVARIDAFTPEELNGGIIQGDRRVILSNVEIADAGWPGPPRIGDVVLTDGGTQTTYVRGVASKWLQGAVVRHELSVRGS
jgi:hypothetical protein